MNPATTSPKDRISFPFFLALGILTLVVFIFITLPADLAALVCIVRGPAAYFHDGIRIGTIRPARFTDGQLVPSGISAVVGIASALLTMWLVGGSLLAIRNFTRGHFGKRGDDAV
jgi:hypothetical protein